MRLLVTSDLHYDHANSRDSAAALIERINAEENIDAVVLAGDTAGAAGSALEECLGLFRRRRAMLFVPGNHELWTQGGDSYALFAGELPRRVRNAGWQWLQTDPFAAGRCAVVGSIGWYDYSFATDGLGIPRRFYEHKMSPGAAAQLEDCAGLSPAADDVPPAARELVARWNDGRFVNLGRSDEEFLQEILGALEAQLAAVSHVPHVAAVVHHVPFAEMLPEADADLWRFTRAFLGSRRIGELLLRFANVRCVLCGHSHYPVESEVEGVWLISIGSGYRRKIYRIVELPD